MRIISDFKDYYDCVQAHDTDRSLVYIRKPKTFDYKKDANWPFPKCPTRIYFWKRFSTTDICIREYIVGFCGKIYPVLHIDNDVKKILIYNIEELDSHLKSVMTDKQWEEYNSREKYQKYSWLDRDRRRFSFEQFFNECYDKQSSYLKLFEDNRSPIFVAKRIPRVDYFNDSSDVTITFDTNLKGLDFYKWFDVNSAYQEIVMFLNNMAVPIKPIPVLDDVTMAESKGFNKYSFRKDKTKPKRGKRK